MENSTSTQNTKEIDEAVKFDESEYKKSQMRIFKRIITWKAICNDCGSYDNFVYPYSMPPTPFIAFNIYISLQHSNVTKKIYMYLH